MQRKSGPRYLSCAEYKTGPQLVSYEERKSGPQYLSCAEHKTGPQLLPYAECLVPISFITQKIGLVPQTKSIYLKFSAEWKICYNLWKAVFS
jgi:hypothetical protein